MDKNTLWLREEIAKLQWVVRDDELIAAARSGDLDTVISLIKQGADIDVQDRFGRTPLIWASYCGHVDIVRKLCSLGATVTIKDMADRSALDWAVLRDHGVITCDLAASQAYDEPKNKQVLYEILVKKRPAIWPG